MQNINQQKEQKPRNWFAAISAELITRGAPGQIICSPMTIGYFGLSRPWEAGRNVIMCRGNDGLVRDIYSAIAITAVSMNTAAWPTPSQEIGYIL